MLRMSGISKSFAGIAALSNVSFDLRAGEVHALMGENGAGKSTLMRILAGVHRPDSGQIFVEGREVEIHSPRAAAEHGIAIIHQELSVVPDMTVAENLALGQEPLTRLGTLDRKRIVTDAYIKLARVRADIDPNEPMRRLSVGMQQLVEIAKAISSNARILILDEPTAALSTAESQTLFELIHEMRAGGMGLALISHRLDEVWELSDRVTVFRDGQFVATTERKALTPHEVVSLMIGRKIQDLYARGDRARGPVVMDVSGLTDGAAIGPTSLQVHAGEVVGMFGLIGAGRTEFARLIFGADRARGGHVSIDGAQIRHTDPHEAIQQGIGLLPESRKEQGLFLEMSIRDNISISSLKRFSRFGILNAKPLQRAVQLQMERLRITGKTDGQTVRELSGGNQQKVLLARWLEVGVRALILDEPTRGVDIGARSEIYGIINDLASAGVAILVVSSDLPEVIGISDRILVFRGGRVVKDILGATATEKAVMLHATGLGVADGQVPIPQEIENPESQVD